MIEDNTTSAEYDAEQARQSPHVADNLRPFQFQPGDPDHKAGPGRPARLVKKAPETPAEIRALLTMVLDADTADAMVKSLRKKLGRANVSILEWFFDRTIGRPAVNVTHDMDGALAQFMSAWQQLGTGATVDDGRTIEGTVTVLDNEDVDEDRV